MDKSNHRRLPHSIPHSLGLDLTMNTMCTFTSADLVPYSESGGYFPLPNYPILKAVDDTNILESNWMNSSFNDFSPVISSPPTRSGTTMLNNPMDKAAKIREELDRRTKVIANLESKIREKE